MKTEPIAEFFDRECCAVVAQEVPDDVADDPVAVLLVEAIESAGLAGSSVLEFGSGDGSLSRGLLARGAGRVTGLDLSPRSVEHAAQRAAETGLADRAGYRVADAAVARLEAHDVVVSSRVLCCYPDARQLLANTLPAARELYVLALPESRGAVGVLGRLFVVLANGWQRLHRDPFRSYLHDVRAVERTILAAGFRRVSSARHHHWLVLAFSRVSQSPS
jgi:SAM-dependent methyltransferase